MSYRTLVPTLAFVACAASVVIMVSGPESVRPAYAAVDLNQARDAGHFRLRRLDGTLLDSEQLRGKVVVLDVWASWCGPCLTEIPALDELYAQYRADGVEVIGVTVDSGDAAQIRKLLADHFPVDYTMVVGDADFEEQFGPLWALPETFLIDADWQIRKSWMGAAPAKQAQLRTLIERLLAARDD